MTDTESAAVMVKYVIESRLRILGIELDDMRTFEIAKAAVDTHNQFLELSGLVIVPRTPTDSMLDEALLGYDEDETPTVFADWRAMIRGYEKEAPGGETGGDDSKGVL